MSETEPTQGFQPAEQRILAQAETRFGAAISGLPEETRGELLTVFSQWQTGSEELDRTLGSAPEAVRNAWQSVTTSDEGALPREKVVSDYAAFIESTTNKATDALARMQQRIRMQDPKA